MRVFLSHSSADKQSYADIVAEKLGGRVEYDSKTFEEGMENLEEIIKALARSELFVVLLSQASLNSKWVKEEISQAKNNLDSGKLKKIFPIVIDRTISYDDERIPEWISETFNLRPIPKPTVAAKRIRERLLEMSWNSHPTLKKRQEVFVGRNSLIDIFEQRMDDLDKKIPTAIFVSGLSGIGRKSVITHALKKSNTIKPTYKPLRISLSRDDSIEGFLLKLYDTGIFEGNAPEDLMSIPLESKINIASKYISQLPQQKEILLIEDQRCIVRYDQSIAPWFLKIIKQAPEDRVLICIASAAKAKQYEFIKDDRLFFLHVSELEPVERRGLLKRYVEDLFEIDVSREALSQFSKFLTGLPEQVAFAAHMIKEIGPGKALQNSNDIVAFSKLRAGIYLRKYEEDTSALAALRFLSSFEFFSLDFAKDIEKVSGKELLPFIDEFILEFVCEPVGSSNYYRINEIIRDAITRDILNIDKEFKNALNVYVSEFSKCFDKEHYDVSEYYIAVREALISGEPLSDRLMIPAHFLKTMKDLYTSGRYDDVIRLADRVLYKKENYDEHITQDIIYYLCQSLARNKDSRFTTEVQEIKGPEHDFLFGFYYRLRGRYDDALERYKKAICHDRTEQRAAREIVFVLITIEDYDEAISRAKEMYERYPQNPFMVQAYLQCVMHSNGTSSSQIKELAHELLNDLRTIGSERAEEMHATQSARVEFQFGDAEHAFSMIDESIKKYPNIEYPILTKLDMAIHHNNIELISDALKELEQKTRSKSHLLAKKKASIILCALKGNKDQALRMIEKDLTEMSKSGRDRIKKRIISL